LTNPSLKLKIIQKFWVYKLRIGSLVSVRSVLSRAQRIVAYLTPQEVALFAEGIEANRKSKSPPAPLRPLITSYGNEIPFHLDLEDPLRIQ